MTQKTTKIIGGVCGVLLSLLLAVAGICLAAACVSIWRGGGDDPFSREGVAAALAAIALPLYICVGGVLAVGALSLFLPFPLPATKPSPDRRDARDRALAAIQPNTLDEETKATLAAEGKRRRAWRIACGVVMGAAVLLLVLYLLFDATFTVDTVNADVAAAVCVALPAAAVVGAVCMIASAKADASYKTETAALRLARGKGAYPAKKGDTRRATEEANRKNRILTVSARSAVAFVGVLFVVLGMLNGGMLDVLEKAVKICTECIGLG